MKVIVLFTVLLSFGATKPAPRDLSDDIQEFIDLIPLDEIKDILDEHLKTDGGTAAALNYLKGDDWTNIVATVGAIPDVQDLLQYLRDAGLPVDDFLTAVHDTIANAEASVEPDEEGSLRPLLDEIENIIPVDDLLALLVDKLQSSADFQALYVKVSSEDTHELVDTVLGLDQVEDLLQKLRDFDVKVDEVLEVVYGFLGWGAPPTKH